MSFGIIKDGKYVELANIASNVRDNVEADEMTGATADADGTSGKVPAPKAGQEDLFLCGDGTWREAGTNIGETLTHDVAEIKKDLGGLTFSASGTTLSITDGTNTWTLEANS